MIIKLTRYLAFFITLTLLFSCSKLITGNSSIEKMEKTPEKAINSDPVLVDILEKKTIEKPTGKLREDLTTKKGAYNIALLLPLCVESTLDSTFTNLKDLQAITVASADFYDGVRMALDEFGRTGVKFNLHVFDVDKYNDKIDNLILKNKLREMDLVIGPFYTHQAATLSNYIQFNQIPLVLPVTSASLSEFKNPYFIKANTPIELDARKLADFVHEKYNILYRVSIVHNGTMDEIAFLNAFKKEIIDMDPLFIVDEVNIAEKGFDKIDSVSYPEIPNLVLIPSKDASFVTLAIGYIQNMGKVLNKDLKPGDEGYDELIKDEKKYNWILMGHPNWYKMNNLNFETLQKLNTHIPSSYHVNYSDPRVIEFVKRYRNKYRTEPTEFSIKGYDISRYFIRELFLYGTRFDLFLGDDTQKALHTNFKFEPAEGDSTFNFGFSSGWHNGNSTILKFENFELKEVH
ncbi:MAG: ABC-type branched-subunit amino acid transport system substrate-binding protein [Sphingobacteriales bacterium]|jgi:ABC-type branched-subunit amino acid transport system substrate-binding protein